MVFILDKAVFEIRKVRRMEGVQFFGSAAFILHTGLASKLINVGELAGMLGGMSESVGFRG